MDQVKKNLIIMWTANFFIGAGATMIMPFLSLYIETMGSFSDAYVQKWAGYVFGITFLTAFFFSPIWGRVGDKYGRKLILIITGTGIALCTFAMGKVDTVEELFMLRLIMGAVTGFIPTSIALIATQTPKERSGEVLGTLQTGVISGSLFGPVLGGIMADAVGFHLTFYITSAIIFFSTILVAVGVKEIKVKIEERKERPSSKQVFKMIFQNKILINLFIVTLIIQIANFSIQPLLALYVSELSSSANIAFLAGFAFSATGLGNLLASRKWGQLGDKIGYSKVLTIVLLLAALIYIPQAFVTNVWQLVILRFLVGIQIGAMLPAIHALIRQVSPTPIQGEVFGYKTSFQFLGNVLGPLLGGLVAASWGISSVFYVTGALLVFGACITYYMRKSESSFYEESSK